MSTAVSVIDCLLSLDCFTTWRVTLRPAEAMEYSRKSYSVASPGMIQEIDDAVPAVPNKAYHHYYEVGRENSTVLYLHVYKNNYLNAGVPDYAKMEVALKRIAASYRADEYDVIVNDKLEFSFRFWWD